MSDYVPLTERDIEEMLAVIGIKTMDELYSDVPPDMFVRELDIPKGKSQQEVLEFMQSLASKNVVYETILRGAGSYYHFIPPTVKSLATRSEFMTAYTPYQAEISQGILQAIFEYQSMICFLTGMDVANASVYNGASAAAEAVLMCKDRERNKVVIFGEIKPDTLKTIKTYSEAQGMVVSEFDEKEKTLADFENTIGSDLACIYLEQPSYCGDIYDAKTIGEIAHRIGAKFIMGCNPISLAILKSPSECLADIAVGEAQPLGLPMAFGGPYLGFMACTDKMMRKLPGRIVGETVDRDGKKAYVLTLQAREQHIRRERASSNICSNQALCALTSTIYLASIGKQGLVDIANSCVSLAHYFSKELSKIEGVSILNRHEFFHEFITVIPDKSDGILRVLAKNKILGGLKLGADKILWCVTEMVTKETLDIVVDLVRGVVCC